MSPDCPPAKMADDPMDKPVPSAVELNNNNLHRIEAPVDDSKPEEGITQKEPVCEKPQTKKSFASDGSDSGSTSDSSSSESGGVKIAPRKPVAEAAFSQSASEPIVKDKKQIQEGLARQCRSLSEGAVINRQVTADGDAIVFPNLRDSVLQAMGLLPTTKKEHLTDEEIETNFQTLTLAFAIDSVTLVDRFERLRRQRDQAENNMCTEMTRFSFAIQRLHPLCVDAETTELVTGLLAHLDVINQATRRILTSAEVYGSVQQEWRLAESVNLMLSHLRNLKQQRDTARKQLQCTKRMLQDSSLTADGIATSPSGGAAPGTGAGNRRVSTTPGGRVVTRRRASIATIPRPLDSPSAAGPAGLASGPGTTGKRGTRRTASLASGEHPRFLDIRHRQDWSPVDRVTPLLRTSRPSRLELNLDLVKIQEGKVETAHHNHDENDSNSDSALAEFETPSDMLRDPPFEENMMLEPRTFRRGLANFMRQIGALIEGYWNTFVESGVLHEVCILGAFLCFAFSTIIIGNLILEIEYSRRGMKVLKIPWAWATWEEILAPFRSLIRRTGPPPV